MKKLMWTVIAILGGGAILLVALLPTILSSEAGTNFLIKIVERNTGGQLKVQDLSLGWTSKQQIDKLQFNEGKGLEVTFDSLTSDCSFWNLLFRSGSVGNTHIENLNISAYPKVSQKKVDALKEAGKAIEKPKGKFWSDFSGHLTLSNGKVTIRNGGSTTISIYGIKMDLDIGEADSFLFEGKTRKNELVGTFFAQGTWKALLEGTATLDNVPVEGLDQVISIFAPKYQGLLIATLGDTVNANLKSTPIDEELKVEVSVRSPRLLIDLNPTYKNGELVLNSPGRVALTLKPLLFNYFNKDVSLQNDAQTEIRLEKGSLPFTRNNFDFSQVAIVGNLYFSEGQLLLSKIQRTLDIDQLNVNFSTSALNELIQMSLKSAMRYQKGLQSSVSGTFSIQNILKTPSYPALDLSIDNLPLSLVDSFSSSSLVTYLGDTYSGKIAKTQNSITLNGNTPLLNLQNTSLILSDVARLTAPSTFTYLVTPNLYENLTRPFKVQGDLNALSIPINKEGLIFKNSDFDLKLSSGQIEVSDLFALGNANLPSFGVNLKGTSLFSFQFEGVTTLDYQDQTWGHSILGENVGVRSSGRAKIGDEFEISPLNLSLDGRKFKGDIAAAIEKSTLILTKGVQIDFLLEPSQINPILSKESEYPLLTKATPLQIEIKPSQIPLKEGDFASLSVKGVGKIANLDMVNPVNRYPFNFENVQVDFDLDGKKNAHSVHFEGEALENGGTAGKLELTLVGNGKASELISSPIMVRASLSNFSSQIADVFFKTRGQLPDLIGPILDLKYAMGTAGGRQNLDIQIESRGLTLDGAFYAGETLELRSPRKPLKIRWDLSEKSYDAFRRLRNPNQQITSNNPLFTVDGLGVLKIQISPFSVPLKDQGEGFPKPDFNLFGSRFDANVRIDDLKLKQSRTGATTVLEKFDFDIAKKQAGNTPLAFKFNGNVSPLGERKSGVIQGSGTIMDFLSNAGTLDFKDVSTSIHARIRNLPSVFVDALSKFDKASDFPPSAFLGDLFNATFDADVEKSQGKITMDIDASACRANFSGIISNEVLYLEAPLKAVFTVTPQLNDVLQKSAKLVVVAMGKPITLYIHDEGFNVPLKDLHIKNMSFKYGQLDLGQILCKNAGSTSEVGGLFKTESRGNVSLWFAPAGFNMNRGKMYVDRTEILYNKAYQVCLWGNIRFPKRYVDMTLGLTAQALRSALSIQGIDDNYVLKVPVEGPFGNVEIDTAAATGKIAFLVARKQIAPKAGIWGQVLGAVGDLADDQSDVPPPKTPFPWQAQP
ncbi:MAG: hypothetical protein KFB95_05975 [Simkaniaceae bacterium]|nr:MAG: hypothetical protein KFB95_05975 [Simkaniaceae bacterium]